MPNPIIHFEVAAQNGKNSIDFYNQLFDWKIEFDQKMNYGMVAQQGSGIGGGVYQTKDGVPPHVTFYVQVDDLQKYLDKAVQLGGKVTLSPTQISPEIGWCAMFTDPDGNAIGLFK
jgi:predicted enzyme related to lactoylglutathione lyase